MAGQLKPPEVPEELELDELEEDELDELDELELDEEELELDELELLLEGRPELELLLELLLDELLLLAPLPVIGSAPQAVRAAIAHAKSVLLNAEGIGIEDPQRYRVWIDLGIGRGRLTAPAN